MYPIIRKTETVLYKMVATFEEGNMSNFWMISVKAKTIEEAKVIPETAKFAIYALAIV